MYFYIGHLSGELYTSDEFLDYEDLYCEICGDSDICLGHAETKEEAWDLLKDDVDIDGSGGWNYEYVKRFIDSNFEEDQIDG